MPRKFEVEDDKPVERMYLVDGVYVPEAEFDKQIDRKLWWIYFGGDAFEAVGALAILVFVIWLIKG